MYLTSLTLMRRQFLRALRKPHGLWVFGAGLTCLAVGFVLSYTAVYGFAFFRVAPGSGVAEHGRQLLAAYAKLSLFALAVFLPPLGVSAIAEDREKRRLELLLTLPASAVVHVASKLLAPLGMVLIAIVGVLPLSLLALNLGGVDPVEVFYLLGVQADVALMALLIGMWAGSRASTLGAGLFVAYGVLTGAVLLVLLLSLTFSPGGAPGVAPFVSFRALLMLTTPLTAGCFLLLPEVSRRLRFVETEEQEERSRKRPDGEQSPLWMILVGRPRLIGDRMNPVFACERRRFLVRLKLNRLDSPHVLAVVSLCLFAMAVAPEVMLGLSLLVAMVFVPIWGATAFSGELERGTWESLKTTLLGSNRILRGKLMWVVCQGLISAGAFYLPALLLYSLPWVLAHSFSGSGVRHAGSLWGAHFSNLLVIGVTVILFSAFSLWCSARCRRGLPALLFAYVITALFMALPRYVGAMYGVRDRILAGSDGDVFTRILAIWHSPYLFHWWSPGAGPSAGFWPLFSLHLLFLLALAALVFWDTRRLIAHG